MVESVRDAGGEVKIFSSMHISGERKHNQITLNQLISIFVQKYNNFFNNFSLELSQLTGVAAILRFPMPELEDEDEDEDDDNDSDE